MKRIVASLFLVFVASCKQPAQRAEPFSFNERIGWLHGPCLAISAPELAAGTPVTLIIAAEPQTVQESRIQGKTDSSQNCPALLADRAKVNQKPGTVFYALEGNVGKSDMGFAIVMPPAAPVIVNGQAQIDLDHDGKNEIFTSCATSEGIKFDVWSEKPYRGEPRWSAYYYLAYDLTPTCP